MIAWLQRYRGLIIVGVLLAMPLVLLYAQTKTQAGRGPVVGFFVDVAALLQRAMMWATGGISDGLEHYVTSVASYDELVALRRHDQTAASLRAEIAELEWQNEELRRLARSMERIDGPTAIGARVVARSGAPLSNIITVDRGADDGVRRGDGVVSADGVVGQVLVVGRHASDVLLLTDPGSAIDVVVQRTRARGLLRGAGDDDHYGCKVEDFDRLRDVKPGDEVVTSGLGARFPPGLLVGTIESAETPNDGLYLTASVQPAARFARVEHVAILVARPTPRVPRLGTEVAPEPEPPDAGVADGGPLDGGGTLKSTSQSATSVAAAAANAAAQVRDGGPAKAPAAAAPKTDAGPATPAVPVAPSPPSAPAAAKGDAGTVPKPKPKSKASPDGGPA